MIQVGLMALLVWLVATPLSAQPMTRDQSIARISDQGYNHSQVLLTAEQLADRIGPRLTNSPAMREAERWTSDRFRQWGLTSVRREPVEFGRGWSIDRSDVRLVAPRGVALRAVPIAWTPPTPGVVTAPVVVAPISADGDLDSWKGRLRGKIVLVDLPSNASQPSQAPFQRLEPADLSKLDRYPEPAHEADAAPKWLKTIEFQSRLDAFLKQEGAIARVRQARADGGRLFGEGYQHVHGSAVPAVELAAEDYRLVARLARTGPVTLSIDSQVEFHDEDRQDYNVLADMVGTDPSAGYVMAGAHLDSWVAADGAADNGAGVAVVMEAARILSQLKVRPRRTIRFALWTGEEQGLLGSTSYIERHVARRAASRDSQEDGLVRYARWDREFPIAKLADYDQLAAYFNVDNGSGRIRGIYAEGNLAAIPVLETMIAPLRSMGVEKIAAEHSGGSDHDFFAALGLPAFEVIQDPLDYETRVHHSSLDRFDHLVGDDLRQASVVLAALVWQCANAPEQLPRTPLPTQPEPTDPFAYPDPKQNSMK